MKKLMMITSFLFALTMTLQSQAQMTITSCNSSDYDCYKEYRLRLTAPKNDLAGQQLYNQIRDLFDKYTDIIKSDIQDSDLIKPSWKRSFSFSDKSMNYHHYFKLSIVEQDAAFYKNRTEPAQAYIQIMMNVFNGVRDAKYTLSASSSKKFKEAIALPADGLELYGFVDFSGFQDKPKVMATITFKETNSLITIHATSAFYKNSFFPKMPY